MADIPILFSAPMVRALLEGRKTQTRRVLKPQPEQRSADHMSITYSGQTHGGPPDYMMGILAKYGTRFRVGDRLWVKETWQTEDCYDYLPPRDLPTHASIYTLADCQDIGARQRSSIHMPRWASRLTLLVTDVRVQRLQDISEADAAAEGVISPFEDDGIAPGEESWPNTVSLFTDLWESLHGPGAWDENPWVCAISFNVVRANIDAVKA